MTALSPATASEARIQTGTGIAPVVLRTANGAAAAQTGKISELKVGNIVARNLRIVTSPGTIEVEVWSWDGRRFSVARRDHFVRTGRQWAVRPTLEL